MNDAQLEAAARHLCKLRGTNPDEAVPDVTNESLAYITVPLWRNAAVEILDHIRLTEAAQYGRIVG